MNETIPLTAGEDLGLGAPDTAKSRSGVYRLFSALLLKEVDSVMLAFLKSGDVAGAFCELDPDFGRLLDGPDAGKLLNDLAEEYAALFLVPGGIPPYESVRLHGMLNQRPAGETEEFYRRCGLVMNEECRILPDHLGMELEFMAYAAGREAGAGKRGEANEAAKWAGVQEEFFRNHINPWVFAFLRDMQKFSFHPFYKGVASLIERFLGTEKVHLGIPEGNEAHGLPRSERSSVS